ncbi:MAG: GNAT family N-acetyltransferase, partial [bacterium]|nr:GNAT family N-acetyltransferase [bacterium]
RKGFAYEEHLDILMDLTQTQEELSSKMHKERRHNVRRAVNKGTEFKELILPEEIETGLNLLTETYKRVKLPLAHPTLFNAAYIILYPKQMVRYFGAVNNGKLIGMRIVLTYKDLVYDWYAGASHQDRNKYPNDFLPWKIILWGKEQGFHTFDFGGAGKPGVPYGVRDYKLKFGGELVNYGRFLNVH